MKKIISLLCIFLITFCVLAKIRKEWHGPLTLANGRTALATAVTGERLVLKNFMFMAANAGYLYFYSSETAGTATAISNKFYFAANAGMSTLDWDDLDIYTASGQGLGVWTSADLGSDAMYEYQRVAN